MSQKPSIISPLFTPKKSYFWFVGHKDWTPKIPPNSAENENEGRAQPASHLLNIPKDSEVEDKDEDNVNYAK